MPGEVVYASAPAGDALTTKAHRSQADFSLIVSSHDTYFPAASWPYSNSACPLLQSSEDTVYEQDILRNPESIKPWLAYVEFKSRYGTLRERAYVRRLPPPSPLLSSLCLSFAG